MKYRLSKISIAILSMSCASVVFAMDSTGIMPETGGGASIQNQTVMQQGYSSIYTNYATYTQEPTSTSSLPNAPVSCTIGDTQLLTTTYPAASVQAVCTNYTCNNDLEYLACAACLGTCSLFSCSCGSVGAGCSSWGYTWTTTFNGPSVVSSITCGTQGFVTHANALGTKNTIIGQSSFASVTNAALPQLNGLINALNLSFTSGLSSVAAQFVAAGEAVLSALETAASDVGGFFCGCDDSAIDCAFSGGGW